MSAIKEEYAGEAKVLSNIFEDGSEDGDSSGNFCDNCGMSRKRFVALYTGEYKWLDAVLHCMSCFNDMKSENPQEYLRFPYKGKGAWYDRNWLYRFKNPHGHAIFGGNEVERVLGGTNASTDDITIEQQKIMDEKIEAYMRNLTEKDNYKKRSRKESQSEESSQFSKMRTRNKH